MKTHDISLLVMKSRVLQSGQKACWRKACGCNVRCNVRCMNLISWECSLTPDFSTQEIPKAGVPVVKRKDWQCQTAYLGPERSHKRTYIKLVNRLRHLGRPSGLQSLEQTAMSVPFNGEQYFHDWSKLREEDQNRVAKLFSVRFFPYKCICFGDACQALPMDSTSFSSYF